MRSGSPCLFDHVALPVRDIARSRAFYEGALRPFGVKVVESPSGLGFALVIKTSGSGKGTWRPVRCTLRLPRQTAKRLMRSTQQPSRQEGSTTDDPGCALAITPGTTPPSSSTPMGTTSKLSFTAITDVRYRRAPYHSRARTSDIEETLFP